MVSMPHIDGQGARVLIVDDMPAHLDVLRHGLEQHGYKVSVATSGEQALKIAPRTVPDLVLMDVAMPGIDGFAACRALKAQVLTATIPVLFLTSRHEDEALVEGFAAGGVDYITKPFHREEVLARVQTHLNQALLVRRLRAENEALRREE